MAATDELDRLYFEVLAQPGFIRLSPQYLFELIDSCLTRNTMVHTVEAFELAGDCEIARPDLSLYGPNEKLLGQSWNSRVSASCNEAREVGQEAIAAGKEFLFLVWLDKE